MAIRILVAEDNDLVALTLGEQLKSLGYDVIGVAHTGAEAIDLAARLRPDLITMDIRMPEVEGTEATARINAICPTPIIMITAYTDRDTIRRAEVAGAIGYLVKPVKEAELDPAIKIALARFRDVQGLRAQVTELEESLDARKLIERAKGILMQRLGLSTRDAYERLRQRARDKRAKMKDIAQAIIEADELLGDGDTSAISYGPTPTQVSSSDQAPVSDMSEAVLAADRLPRQTPDDTTLLIGALVHRMGNMLGPIPTLARMAKGISGEDRHLERIASKITSVIKLLDRLGTASVEVTIEPVKLLDTIEMARKQVIIPDAITLKVNGPVSRQEVRANTQAVVEILINLIDNAVRAMPDGGGLEIAVDSPADHWVDIRVIDHGRGISQEFHPKLFEPFFTTRKDDGGQGLGLWLSKKLAERFGGALMLEKSAVGKGTTFLLKLQRSDLSRHVSNDQLDHQGDGERIKAPPGKQTYASDISSVVLPDDQATRQTTDDMMLLIGALVPHMRSILEPLPSLAREANVAANKDQYLDLIAAEVTSANKILNRLSTISVEPEIEPLNVLDAFMVICEQLTVPDAVQFDMSGCNSHHRVYANAQILAEIVTNLIDNAVHAMPDGGVLRITSESDDYQWTEIRIIDDGHGIPQGIQPRLFDPFFTTRKDDGGQGLGLWLSKKLTERLGGVLLLEHSEQKSGTRFLLKLPHPSQEDNAGDETS